MKRLTTESQLKPLIAQFVPIKIDVKSKEYQAWARKHKPPKNAIPQMFIVRADGEELFNQVGGLPTDKLATIMTGALEKSGVGLNEQQVAEINSVIEKSKTQIEQFEYAAAIKTINKIPGAMDESVACYAQPVIELRKVVTTIKENGDKLIQTCLDRLAESDNLDFGKKLLLTENILRVKDGFKSFKPCSAGYRELALQANRNGEIKTLMSDLSNIERLGKSKSAAGKQTLQDLAEKYKGTRLVSRIETALASIKTTTGSRGGATWRSLVSMSAREWSSKSGKFKVIAKPVAISKDAVKLEREDGDVVSVKLTDLSTADNAWVEENLRQ
jgi:hypothetical protein